MYNMYGLTFLEGALATEVELEEPEPILDNRPSITFDAGYAYLCSSAYALPSLAMLGAKSALRRRFDSKIESQINRSLPRIGDGGGFTASFGKRFPSTAFYSVIPHFTNWVSRSGRNCYGESFSPQAMLSSWS